MLFCGVQSDDLELWAGASVVEPAAWKNIIGIDVAKASDPSRFRVLEWGGMEVR
jgi:ubiquitin C